MKNDCYLRICSLLNFHSTFLKSFLPVPGDPLYSLSGEKIMPRSVTSYPTVAVNKQLENPLPICHLALFTYNTPRNQTFPRLK